MYDNCVSVFGIAFYTIASVIKEYILIVVIINYQIKTKVRNYIENTPFNKIFFKVLTPGILEFFLNSGNSGYKIFLIKLLDPLF